MAEIMYDKILSMAGISQATSLLDLGCGIGMNADFFNVGAIGC